MRKLNDLIELAFLATLTALPFYAFSVIVNATPAVKQGIYRVVAGE